MQAPRRGSYGFDAPYVPALMGLGGTILMAMAVIATVQGGPFNGIGPGVGGLWLLACAASYVYTTRAGKFVVWGEVLDAMKLRGDEAVLDMGCGRGAVLLLAAQKTPAGKASGIDLWSTKDQSGNAETVARHNAELEGVSERVSLQTGDMRTMPFADASFDVVVSSLAIHNIPDEAGRATAIREAARVLKAGGRLAIADFRFTEAYATELQKAGLTDVQRRGLGWRCWYGGPWASTTMVTARRGST